MKKFKKIYVEVTNSCNLDCYFCPKTQRPKKEMTEEFFENVLRKIKPHTDYIYMHVMGEPLSHSKINRLLEICEEQKIKANITTNGTLLPVVGEKLFEKSALRQMNISIHSFEDKNEESYKKYIKGILDFIKLSREKDNVIFCLRLWNIEEEKDDKFSNIVINMLKETFGVEKEIIVKATDRNGIKLANNIYLQQEERFTWPKLGGEEIFTKGKCFGLKTHIGILADGTVIPCCLDSEGIIDLGNIMDNDLEEILGCERTRAIADGFKNSKVVEELCKTCGFRHNV